MTEAYFKPFRDQIIGIDQEFPTPFGIKKMIYADWIASGRLYGPIESKLMERVFPFCANPHTETSITGTMMTKMYLEAKRRIKQEVNANEEDILIFEGSGMTACINKLQRIMGLRIPERSEDFCHIACEELRPVVFVTHMEHHSNQTSWLETIADVEIIQPTEEGAVDLSHFQVLLEKYQARRLKIASVTAASNVTGILVPYHEISKMIHAYGGYCMVDFACSGPYVHINMHPENKDEALDAIFLSPHKFLGGPGACGLMLFNRKLYKNKIPDHSGGGTVTFTTPWQTHEYIENIEDREDGGTPPFLQGIKTALCFALKSEMGVDNMLKREEELLAKAFERLERIGNLQILQGNLKNRLGCISFYIEGMHFNFGVKLLNDLFGIQVRGGCACAGTYGHYLLGISQSDSNEILQRIKNGDLFARPGWIRLSLHPTLTEEELDAILDGIEFVAANFKSLEDQYVYIKNKNIFRHKDNERNFSDDQLLELFESGSIGINA